MIQYKGFGNKVFANLFNKNHNKVTQTVTDTNKEYAILLSTNFEEGTNAKLLGITKVYNQEELRRQLECEFVKLKTSIVNSLGDDETFNDHFSTDVSGMCYSIAENCDDSTAILYEIYAQVIEK